MCIIGKALEVLNLIEDDNVIGYREFYIKDVFKGNRILSGLNYTKDLQVPIGESDAIPTLDNTNGLWSYNYNYYNNYNYNYYNYCVTAKIQNLGTTIKHEIGYRANKIKVLELVLLTPKDIDSTFNKFIEHFNSVVSESAKLYNAETVNHVNFK